MGMFKRKQSLLDKEGIGPALMVPASPAASAATAFAQDAPNPSPHPAILGAKGRGIAVLEISKPSLQSPVEIFDNDLQAMSVGAPRLDSDRVSKFPEALLPWPFLALFEVVAQKVEAPWLGGVHNPRLDWMQPQSGLLGPLPHLLQGVLGFPLAPRQDHKVIGIAHHLDPCRRHRPIQRIELDVRQQRTQHGALRRSRLRRPALAAVHDLLLQ